MIQTVTGPIAPTALGITLGHEHVLSDGWAMWRTYDAILDDEALAVTELLALADAGGRAIVDCTSIGLRPRPADLARISDASGVRIVLGAGWYREAVHPPEIRRLDADALAAQLIDDLTVGMAGSGIRAGFIGEIGTERGRISPAEERVFRAAARAQRATGVSIWTHTTNAGELALDQVALLRSEGVPVDRIVVSHVGDRIGFRHLAPLAATGVGLSVDNIGYTGGGFPEDAVRIRNVLDLVAAGHASQVMLGGDTCTRSMLAAYGGPGYARVLTDFVPRLAAAGLEASVIEAMLVHNPARYLEPDA